MTLPPVTITLSGPPSATPARGLKVPVVVELPAAIAALGVQPRGTVTVPWLIVWGSLLLGVVGTLIGAGIAWLVQRR